MRIWNPSRSLQNGVRSYYRARYSAGILGKVRRRLIRSRHAFWSIVTSTDIRLGAKIGERLMLVHPLGIVIHEAAEIGDDCMIMQNVTIGQLQSTRAPKIGDGVFIGVGACLLGDITIGDNARIGANAVVLKNVPARMTAIGVPARILPRRERLAEGKQTAA